MKRMEDGEGEHLSLISLSSSFPEGCYLFCPDLCDVVRDVGCSCPMSSYGGSPRGGLTCTEEGCGSGSHRGSESG